ncbi:MAG: hypothetical protein ACW991_04345 [Candidatus Hodarchaeales archaeon]|jgi:hypothetical protein
MSDTPQDAISFKQKFVKVLRGKETEVWNDEKLVHLIKILQNGPMTLDEISAEYRLKAEKKSDITLYRYLNKLEKLKLVIPGGKRVSMNEKNQLKSQTLYVRTAKLFFKGDYPNLSKNDKSDVIVRATGLILGQMIKNKKASEDSILNLIEEIENRRINLIEELVKTAGDQLLELLADVDWKDINVLINRVGWLALILEEIWNNKISECYH